MSNLTCGVTNCKSNAQGSCSLSNIMVNGPSACSCAETCCASFESDNGFATNYAAGKAPANSNMAINCNAHECCHNASGACNSDCVCVTGAGACTCNETECGSFEKR